MIILGSNIYFWLYKNPRFKDQFEEIKKIIAKEEKYEDFEFIIQKNNNIGYVYAKYNIENDDYDITEERVEFWDKIAQEYFRNEIILIDRSESGEFEENSVLYFHQGNEIQRPAYNKEINFVRDFSEISLRRYNEPFELTVYEGE